MTAPQTPEAPQPGADPQGAPGAADQQAPQYVYGVTVADAALPAEVTGLDGNPVSLVAHGPCAAVVSDLPQGRPLGERADLLAHQGVLEALISEGTVVLPFRFGAAMTGTDAVRRELLEPNGESLAEVLRTLDGKVELRLKGTYVQENVLREVMAEDPEISSLNERLRSIPADAADAAYYDRVRLGELIARALEQRRDRDGQALLEALAPLAEHVVARTPMREEDVVDASFLVDHERRQEFEQAVEKHAADRADRVRLRLIGPLPPYDFVPEA
ncbi:GvpL/GvpF family gas vesicle protein [Spirillospora sp. CA-253888]